MKIVSWNCNGALRNKIAAVDSLGADILVIQECENPSLSTPAFQNWAGDYLWLGTSKNKGIGVFPKNHHKVEALQWNSTFQINKLQSKSTSLAWESSDLKLFLPFLIDDTYQALAVWTKGSNTEIFAYMGQFWKYLQIHRHDLAREKTIILGDFNSNAIWDKQDRWWNHSDVVNELTEMGIHSLYHWQYNEKHGKETAPTFYLHRKEIKPYHIDYIFLSQDLLPKSHLVIGQREDWIAYSDHMPVSLKIATSKKDCISTNLNLLAASIDI